MKRLQYNKDLAHYDKIDHNSQRVDFNVKRDVLLFRNLHTPLVAKNNKAILTYADLAELIDKLEIKKSYQVTCIWDGLKWNCSAI